MSQPIVGEPYTNASAKAQAQPQHQHGLQSDCISIVGAGLAGCMCALLMAQKGLNVRVFEARPDFRLTDRQDGECGRLGNAIKRSINLSLSYRGICALKHANIFEPVKSLMLPMKGRTIHSASGELGFRPYGLKDHQIIYSISRLTLNRFLLEELEKLSNVQILFGTKVECVQNDASIIVRLENGQQRTFPSSWTIGADGAYSRVRVSLQHLARCDVSLSYLSEGYKELRIPPTSKGNYAMPKWQAVHVWPRHQSLVVAMPNPDYSFTAILFAPFTGPEGLDSIQTEQQIQQYFKKYFPDLIPIIPDLVEQYQTSPNSALVTVRCKPWHYKDKILLIGDAAHAVVPFYGQGMNCAFEDCLYLSELYDKFNGDMSKVISVFSGDRCPAGEALADLSLQNYRELRDHMASKLHHIKQSIDTGLHWLMPSVWQPRYTMVAFSRLPYHQANRKATLQDNILKYTILILSMISVWAFLFVTRPTASYHSAFL